MYIGYGVNLSPAQVNGLSKGQTVRLRAGDLTGSDKVFLTKTQIAKIQKCRAAKKGCDLKLSTAQLKHHMKGGSVLDTAWGGLKSAGNTIFNELIKPIVSNVGQMALPRIQQRGNQLATDLVNRTLNRVGAGARKKQRGKGVWDDIWSGVKSVGQNILPTAVNVGTSLLAKRLGMGLRRRRRTGGSFKLPGG